MSILEEDFGTAIAANATSDGYALTYGTNVFPFPEIEESPDGFTPAGGSVAIPHKAVFLTVTDGVGDGEWTLDNQKCEKFLLDVDIRGAVDEDYNGGALFSRAVAKAINRRPPTGYVNCFVLGTGPRYEGRDDNQRHRWRVRLVVEKHTTPAW